MTNTKINVMLFKNYILFLLLCALIQSCSSYNKAPITLKQSIGKGKILTADKRRKFRKFDKIILVDSAYYGVVHSKKFIPRYVPIPENQELKFYPEKQKVQKIWVALSKRKDKGVLYSMSDSSISVLISNSKAGYKKWLKNMANKKEVGSNNFRIEEFKVREIKTIKVRKSENVKKGIAIGAISGAAIGLIVGEELLEKIAGGLILGIFGIPAGAIIGSGRLGFPIHGDIAAYQGFKSHFSPIIKDQRVYRNNELKLIPYSTEGDGDYHKWKVFVSQHDISAVGNKETKMHVRRTETIIAAIVLIPLTFFLMVGMVHPY